MGNVIFDQLKNDILEGLYKPGDQLPSENYLAEKYSLPRITIRQSYEILENMGYIYSKQGKGRFVRPKQQKIELAINGKESFTQKVKKQGLELKTINISSEKIEYNSKIYDYLQAEKSEQVYKLILLRISNKQPVAIHTSFIKESIFPNFKFEAKKIVSMFDYFTLKGYTKLNSSKTVMSVTLPTSNEEELLCCPSLVPIILFESDTITGQGQVLQFSKILYRSDSFHYIINF